MTTQLLLPYELQRTIEERFDAFHRTNPDVYELMVRFAVEAARAGWTRYGVKSLYERVRWHQRVDCKDSRDFKLNNDFTSRYARLLNSDPRIQEVCGADFFETRQLKAV